jgi:hypothetical protein
MNQSKREKGPMTDAIQQANEAYAKMVSSQLSRATVELKRLDELLKAGRVDGRVLSEFREAVNRVRTSGWQVQVWIEGDPRALSVLLMEERIRLATRLANQLATEISSGGREFLGLGALKEAIQQLERVL